MKRKLLTIIAIIAVIFVSAVLWRVDGFVFGDRMNWAEAQARGQMVAMRQSIRVELKSLERLIYSFNSDNFRKEKINWNSLQPYYAVASLGIGSQGDVLTQNLFVKDKSVAAGWTNDFLNKALGRISVKGNGTQIYVKPFQDGNKGHHVALLFVNRNRAYALVGGGELFQSLIDTQKGSLNSFSVVNTSGLTVGHSVPEYVGTLLTEDPVYKVANQSGVAQGLGIYDSSDGSKIFGLYDQVPDTNLWILSSAPLKDLMKGRTALLWQFFLLGIGLVLVGVGGILVVLRPHEKSLAQLREHAQSLVAGKNDFTAEKMTPEIAEIDELLDSVQTASNATAPVAKEHVVTANTVAPVVVNAPAIEASLDTEKNQREMMMTKMEAYRSVASALGHEMRAPLTSILGYSQMILARSKDAEVMASVDSILRESRAARGVLEKLFSFAGEQDFEKNEMKVEGPLVRSLKNLEPLLENKGVKLEKDFSATEPLPVSIDELTRVFENILTNSVEAMERMPHKDLRVKLFENEEGVHVELADSGEGIESEDLNKIFDPFFTTRSFQNHTGLGLAVALGILKEHNADVKVHSERGQGTTMHIVFRKKIEEPEHKAASTEMTLVETLPFMPEPEAQPVPVAMAAPAAAVKEAQAAALSELSLREESVTAETRPTEVNIDSLLDLPPAAPEEESELQLREDTLIEEIPVPQAEPESDPEPEVKIEVQPQAEAPADQPLPPKAPPVPAPAAKKIIKSSQDEELSFIDGFLDEVKPAKKTPPSTPPPTAKTAMDKKEATPPPPPPPMEIPPEVEPSPLEAMMKAPVDADVPKNTVTPPKAPPPAKKSKLDAFAVNIPKPGKGS